MSASDPRDLYGPACPAPEWAICSNCGTKLADNRSLSWGTGPAHSHYLWGCDGCGRTARVESSTREFVIAQLGMTGYRAEEQRDCLAHVIRTWHNSERRFVGNRHKGEFDECKATPCVAARSILAPLSLDSGDEA